MMQQTRLVDTRLSVGAGVAQSHHRDKALKSSTIWWMLVLVGCALSLWGLIELGFLRGTDGDNDYGPAPLVRNIEAVASSPRSLTPCGAAAKAGP